MANIIHVMQDQDTIKLFGTEYLVDKDKLAKNGEYELNAFGCSYRIVRTGVDEYIPKSSKNKRK